MGFSLKYVTDNELADAVAVEEAAMGTYTYLADANELYKRSEGELIGICDNGKMIGIGRFTVLADRSAWLECLRVAPDYQRMGAGKMIYQEYLKLAEQFECTGMAMYTGRKNIKSSSLAEKFGLNTVQGFYGYHVKPERTEDYEAFVPVTPKEAEELMQYKEKYHDYLSVSRTFYHFNPENLKDFASRGMVYRHAESGSWVIAGARFQQYKALHCALMEGDAQLCLNFLKNLAAVQGIGDIVFTLAYDNPLEEVLMQNGASKDAPEIIVKERIF